jgi:hypothetical protein
MSPPRLHLLLEPVHCWESTFGGEGRDLGSLRKEQRVPQDEDAVHARTADRREIRVDLGRSARLHDAQLHPERLGRALCLPQDAGVGLIARVLENGHPRDFGDGLFEQRQLLPNHVS